MTTIGLERPEPRRFVHAERAEALMQSAALELEDLQARMHQVAAEMETAERLALTAPRDAELQDSSLVAHEFVDDLLTTTRERMREQISRRYTWVGDRLAEAHAEAQAIAGDALEEFTTALAEHDGVQVAQLDDLAVADLIASIGPSSSSAMTTADPMSVSDDEPDDEVEQLSDWDAALRAMKADVVVDSATQAVRSPVEVESGTSLDGVIDAAVRSVLDALTSTDESGLSSSTVDPELAPAVEAPTRDAGSHAREHEAFWGPEVEAPGARRSPVIPQDVLISMLAVVALLVLLLAFIG